MANYLEFYPSPPILLTNKQAESMRRLDLGSKSEGIPEQLSKRKGVVLPGSGLTVSSQRTIEQVQAPPAILLRSNEPASQRPEAPSQEQVHNAVPSPPVIVTQSRKSKPKMKLTYNNFVLAGGEQYDIDSGN